MPSLIVLGKLDWKVYHCQHRKGFTRRQKQINMSIFIQWFKDDLLKEYILIYLLVYFLLTDPRSPKVSLQNSWIQDNKDMRQDPQLEEIRGLFLQVLGGNQALMKLSANFHIFSENTEKKSICLSLCPFVASKVNQFSGNGYFYSHSGVWLHKISFELFHYFLVIIQCLLSLGFNKNFSKRKKMVT